MDREQVLAVLREQAVELLELSPEDIVESKSFKADLDVDSLALVEYTMAVEDELHVKLPDEDVVDLATIGEFVDLIMRKLAAAA